MSIERLDAGLFNISPYHVKELTNGDQLFPARGIALLAAISIPAHTTKGLLGYFQSKGNSIFSPPFTPSIFALWRHCDAVPRIGLNVGRNLSWPTLKEVGRAPKKHVGLCGSFKFCVCALKVTSANLTLLHCFTHHTGELDQQVISALPGGRPVKCDQIHKKDVLALAPRLGH